KLFAAMNSNTAKHLLSMDTMPPLSSFLTGKHLVFAPNGTNRMSSTLLQSSLTLNSPDASIAPSATPIRQGHDISSLRARQANFPGKFSWLSRHDRREHARESACNAHA